MLSQSVPQMFSSAMTIISVFIGMLVTNVWLTLFVLLGVCVMLKVVKKLGGQSAKYFLEQQKSLGRVNGYIEEMINGQKVIKVFCHEEKCKEQFDELNDELRENAASANTFANILMPIMMNIGNLLYVLVAVVGGALALSGVVGNSITIGVIASFLQLTKSFTQPVTQISQQFNSIVMALAGAERIFELMDEEPEVDNGYVTLVNAKYDKKRRNSLKPRKRPTSGRGSTRTRTAPPPTRRSAAMSASSMWISVITRIRSFCTTSRCTPSPVRRSRSSVQPARAKRPSPT